MCRTSPAASAWMAASVPNSSTPAPATADRASPRTRSPCSRPQRITTARRASSRRWSRSTTAASARWAARCLRRSADAKGARGKKVALLGLTFKPNTDDMRDSPAIAVAQTLTDAGVKWPPTIRKAWNRPRRLMPEVTMVRRAPIPRSTDADAVAIVTEWDAFPRPRPRPHQGYSPKRPVLVDLRNIYRPDDVSRAAGFDYSSIGRVAETRLSRTSGVGCAFALDRPTSRIPRACYQ